MATFTTAQMLAAGVAPAGADRAGFPGPFVLEYKIDGTKKTIAAADIVTCFDIPTYTAVIIDGAQMIVEAAATATCTVDVGIAGTDITGLTAFDPTAAAGTKSSKLATAANTVVTTSTASSLTLQFNTAGLGSGRFTVRIYGTIMTI